MLQLRPAVGAAQAGDLVKEGSLTVTCQVTASNRRATGRHERTCSRYRPCASPHPQTVFIVGCEEGRIPLPRSDAGEERRLLYVGATRAEERLVLSWAVHRCALRQPGLDA